MTQKSIELGGRKLTLQTGQLAEQASGAVLASYGETVVLATVVSAPLKQDLGYFPLTVEYQERLYAGGRIKGSRWVKREGRPSDDDILSARLIDRSIRPLFPKNYKKEVQVVITILSVDMENDPTIVSALATSAAIAVSPIPWKGPVATLRVGKKDGTYFINPQVSEASFSDMDLVVSSTESSILMIEAGAREVSEDDILGGIEFFQKEAKKVIKLIDDFSGEVAKEKEVLAPDKLSESLKGKVKKIIKSDIPTILKQMAIHEGGNMALEDLKSALIKELAEEKPDQILAALEKILKE